MKNEKSRKWSLGLRGVILTWYDGIESCREWKVESSHMCKKVLTCVRTHPEELLAPKIWFSWFCEHKNARNEFRTVWQIKKCLDCHPESSQMCKNSSRPTPRPKIWFSWFFEHKRSRNEFITIRQNWKMLGLSFQNNLSVEWDIFFTPLINKKKNILVH